ncbi:hypothetical protein CBR_g54805 [Chara braunii]|uniref:Integrase catalytic domain-containing protein n=1 Tax=Chara braunii TaxID=69332 RepID=A0A388JPF5_CHABU|nr:hypothetical protein CBR_g54805 [Chara braunii]|eukprot:GBG59700.1 hypothetical protein CBR_g54805 [Chara braunii]
MGFDINVPPPTGDDDPRTKEFPAPVMVKKPQREPVEVVDLEKQVTDDEGHEEENEEGDDEGILVHDRMRVCPRPDRSGLIGRNDRFHRRSAAVAGVTRGGSDREPPAKQGDEKAILQNIMQETLRDPMKDVCDANEDETELGEEEAEEDEKGEEEGMGWHGDGDEPEEDAEDDEGEAEETDGEQAEVHIFPVQARARVREPSGSSSRQKGEASMAMRGKEQHYCGDEKKYEEDKVLDERGGKKEGVSQSPCDRDTSIRRSGGQEVPRGEERRAMDSAGEGECDITTAHSTRPAQTLRSRTLTGGMIYGSSSSLSSTQRPPPASRGDDKLSPSFPAAATAGLAGLVGPPVREEVRLGDKDTTLGSTQGDAAERSEQGSDAESSGAQVFRLREKEAVEEVVTMAAADAARLGGDELKAEPGLSRADEAGGDGGVWKSDRVFSSAGIEDETTADDREEREGAGRSSVPSAAPLSSLEVPVRSAGGEGVVAGIMELQVEKVKASKQSRSVGPTGELNINRDVAGYGGGEQDVHQLSYWQQHQNEQLPATPSPSKKQELEKHSKACGTAASPFGTNGALATPMMKSSGAGGNGSSRANKRLSESRLERKQNKRGRRDKVEPERKKDEEDVCFVCYDGGELMLCDRSGPCQQDTSAGHVSRQQCHVSRQQCHVSSREYQVSRPPAWSMLLRSRTAVMDQKSGETYEAYQARMPAWSTETKKRADDVATAAKKAAADAEKARLLTIEQQRQHDEAAAKAVDEKWVQRSEKIFSGEQVLLTMAADWRAEAENGKMEDSENKIALVLSHLTDLLATCITQEEDIRRADSSPQPPPAAGAATCHRPLCQLFQHLRSFEALEMDVGSLKDGVKLQQNATQQLEQRICTAANHSSSEPRETTPKFDGQEIFCDSTKTDPIPWFCKFELTLQLHYVKEQKHHAYLYSRSGGACQAWLDNLLFKYGVVAADLHAKISWDDMRAAWHKRFQVEPPEIKAMDKLMVFEQGTLPSTLQIPQPLSVWRVTTIVGPVEAKGSDCHGHYRPIPQAQDRSGWDLTVVDRLTKFAMFLPCRYHAKAPELAEVLYAGWIRTKGYPKEIVCDRDTRFMSDFWLALIKRWGSSLKPCLARHPQTDGQTERAHQTAQVLLRTLIRPDQKDWVEWLPDVELAYNSSIHPASGMSPFEFEHGSPVTSPLDTIIPRTAESDDHLLFLRRMQELLVEARDQMAKTQQRMSQQANGQRLPCPFRSCDLVWVSVVEFSLEQDISRKLLPKWMGPWPIVGPTGDAPEGPSFTIQVPAHLPVYPVFHCSKLALYMPAEQDDFPGRRSQDPPCMDGFQEVGDIISQRRYDNRPTEYLVHFAYCTHLADLWLTRAELRSRTLRMQDARQAGLFGSTPHPRPGSTFRSSASPSPLLDFIRRGGCYMLRLHTRAIS